MSYESVKKVQKQQPEVLYKKVIFKNVALWRGLQHKLFRVNITKFLRTPFLKNICEQLLLKVMSQDFFACFFMPKTKLIKISDWITCDY